ncbi:hypothetical protein [Microcoleus sp. LEGE 07076]|nr:hypothetical protein [Microcoleus sp. LEGE 07076]
MKKWQQASYQEGYSCQHFSDCTALSFFYVRILLTIENASV